MSNFVEDTKNHKLTIIKDDGVYRHLHCSSGSSCYHFDIVTYPGHLCYSGDMGCFVFQRTKDMFEFFRSESGRINPDYWGGKLEAGKAKEFSEECFMGIINGMVNDACFNMADFFDDISQDKLSKNAVKFKAEVKEHFENNDISAGGWFRTMSEFEARYYLNLICLVTGKIRVKSTRLGLYGVAMRLCGQLVNMISKNRNHKNYRIN